MIVRLEPKNFNRVVGMPCNIGLNKTEYEELVCFLLNQHINFNQPFNKPFSTVYSHGSMVNEGWLIHHSDKTSGNYYCLTRKTLGLLWITYGKC